ncbi:MAG: hypothetical protein ACOY0T_14505 [Myxococcota bacterium]
MAGIFGDEINNRREFFEQLDLAERTCLDLVRRHPNEDALLAVQAQLAAVHFWTAHGRTPRVAERKSLDMALRMFREYEMTEDVEIAEFRGIVSGIHSYVEFWPTDAIASDPKNDQYL